MSDKDREGGATITMSVTACELGGSSTGSAMSEWAIASSGSSKASKYSAIGVRRGVDGGVEIGDTR